ncbi:MULTISPECIES: DUF6059 family protein [Protofrankia]|uniref:Uncharacterized protein n=1 Tax=Candidatus Protofrankia datiscae TaxID=2716812 RepID=F8B4A9_9ACTN|nr:MULTISPECIES: DUF6059 family protein [Protofrankia]AEH09384.1 hypothetical protein FsymDg_1951 [Candidatus Protofrankia datiscae]
MTSPRTPSGRRRRLPVHPSAVSRQADSTWLFGRHLRWLLTGARAALRWTGSTLVLVGETAVFVWTGCPVRPPVGPVESRPRPSTPPGHPERVPAERVPSPAERGLWRELDDIPDPFPVHPETSDGPYR